MAENSGSDYNLGNLEEHDPEFQLAYFTTLSDLLIDKKYGPGFYNEYRHNEVRRLRGDQTGAPSEADKLDFIRKVTSEEPSLPEVNSFVRLVSNNSDVAHLIKFADEIGLGFTEDELQTAKKEAREWHNNYLELKGQEGPES